MSGQIYKLIVRKIETKKQSIVIKWLNLHTLMHLYTCEYRTSFNEAFRIGAVVTVAVGFSLHFD